MNISNDDIRKARCIECGAPARFCLLNAEWHECPDDRLGPFYYCSARCLSVAASMWAEHAFRMHRGVAQS